MKKRTSPSKFKREVLAGREFTRGPCGKVAYPTPGDARRLLKRTRYLPHYKEDGVPLGVYLCRTCDAYHTGHDRLAAQRRPSAGGPPS